MSNEKDPIPTPITTEEPTRPIEGVPQPIERVIAAARTLELHGSPSIAQAALGIARSKIGEREPDRRNHPNEGPIVDWSLEGLTSRDAGGWAQWCCYFACQCVRRALIAAGADAVTIREWRKLVRGGGSCSQTWAGLDAAGLTVRYVQGMAIPQGVYFVFYCHTDENGQPKYHSDGLPDLKHVGVYDRVTGILLQDVSGNTTPTADRVAEGSRLLSSPDIFGFAYLPYDRPGT